VGCKIDERMCAIVVWMDAGKKFNGVKCSKLNKVKKWDALK